MPIDRDTQDEILRATRRVMRTPTGGCGPPSHKRSAMMGIYIAKTSTGGIAAMSTSNVPGSGTVTLYKTSTGALTAHTGSTGGEVTVTAYNIARQAVSGSKFIQLKQEVLTGVYLVDFEDCA